MQVGDPGVALSLALQDRGYRVIVEQEKVGDGFLVTVYLSKPREPDVKGSGTTLASAVSEAARIAGVKI
jgi:hypothetical protein